MRTAQLLVFLASVWAPLTEQVAASVTIYGTKSAKTIPTSSAYAAVASLAAYDQTILNSPSPPNPAITTNFLVQVRHFKLVFTRADLYTQLYPNSMDGLSIK